MSLLLDLLVLGQSFAPELDFGFALLAQNNIFILRELIILGVSLVLLTDDSFPFNFDHFKHIPVTKLALRLNIQSLFAFAARLLGDRFLFRHDSVSILLVEFFHFFDRLPDQ